ncbi:hypothetical protein AHiyo8_56660 [Arthrobacter sp. Hiyo8]|nr:hypothetical protein AHiyo8_56660 [Arthrobacter sp. Hiyo8]
MFFAANPLDYTMSSLLFVVLLGSAERKLGWFRTAAGFFGGQFATVTAFLLVVQLAAYADDGWLGRMMDARTSGPLPATLFVSMAASGLLPTLWRRRLRATAVSLALLLVLYVGDPSAVMALAGAVLGLGRACGSSSTTGFNRATGRPGVKPETCCPSWWRFSASGLGGGRGEEPAGRSRCSAKWS